MWVTNLRVNTSGVGQFSSSLANCDAVDVAVTPSLNGCGNPSQPVTADLDGIRALVDEHYASIGICGLARQAVDTAAGFVVGRFGGRAWACTKVATGQPQSVMDYLKLGHDAVICLVAK